MKTTIYTLSDPRSGEVRYVGKTINTLSKRLSQHICQAKRTQGHKACWVRSLLAEGVTPVIKYVDEIEGTVEHGDWLESQWCLILGASGRLTNATEGGGGGMYTDEARARLSATVKGKPKSPEHRASIKATMTPERRAQISERMKGERNPMFGRQVSPEQREKARVANLGKKMSPESIEKTRAAQLGRKASPETREKLRLSHLGHKDSVGTLAKKKMSQAARRERERQSRETK